MSPRAKRILNYAFIIGTLAVVLLIGVNGKDLNGAFAALSAISPGWLTAAAVCVAVFYVADAFSVWYFLRRQGYHIKAGYSLFISIAGLYYSNITPGATGGQPMQVYYLKKKNVPVGIGTSALTVKFFCFQFMLFAIGAVLWITHAGYIDAQVGGNKWILIFGFCYNAIAVSAIVLVSFHKRLVHFLLKKLVHILAKLHILKNEEATFSKWDNVLETFHASIMIVKRRPLDLALQLLLGAIQLLAQMSVVWCLYKGFALSGATYWEVIALAVMLYTSAAYTPLPGASGAQEGIFALYFGHVFPENILLMALLLWRFFTYYLSLLLGAAVTTAYGIHKDRRIAKRAKAHEGEE